MATPASAAMRIPHIAAKRKHPADSSNLAANPASAKKPRVTAAATEGGREGRTSTNPNAAAANNNNSKTNHTQPQTQPQPQLPQRQQHHPQPLSLSLQLHAPLLAKLSPKYEVKPMSVMPSTSISKHVDKALQHLSRFSAWDTSVLPGVVLLSAKAGASAKLITISELVRRRIGEAEQKWYQYNVLSGTEQIEAATIPVEEEDEVVEDTVMAGGGEDEDGEDEEYFERIQTTATAAGMTIHERAVEPVTVRHKTHLSIFISRVKLEELGELRNVGLQTNEGTIEYLRKKKMGLVA
ncbi:hypothetical protein B0T19DRAFT_89185 [Cercophora scortea]|uniref:DNA/RNA-binding protein Alba-like domain-containing protein n=1 Tax=Cercophora scortea TaxID=314031 RepID=A0AAE0IVA5_9PEZI|nr:hypothetical protein B0T19DRAFT_89185 [Cercophora scortea]